MAHKTFFSFHYERDVQRSVVVRNSSKLKSQITPEWIDASLWEATKNNDDAIRRLIAKALGSSSVTAVLIGAQTASRKWIKYEIDESLKRGNGLFGIYIHNILDFSKKPDSKGSNPLPAGYKTYDWVNDDGYNNLGKWVDAAHAAR